MWGALFGEQVDGYKEAFVYKGEYENAGALMKLVEEQYDLHHLILVTK